MEPHAPAVSGDGDPATPAPPNAAPLTIACEGAGCGAEAGRYGGAGVGVWTLANGQDSVREALISLDGVAGKRVTLLLSDQPALPPVVEEKSASPDPVAMPLPAGTLALGSVRDWRARDDSFHRTSLVRERIAADGRPLRVWIEEGEVDDTHVTEAMLAAFATRLAGTPDALYESVTALGGIPWGPHGRGNLIDPQAPLDVVLIRFPAGDSSVGYFLSRDLLRQSANAASNEALSLYVDTRALYAGSSQGLLRTLSTTAHELTHAINYYRRGVRMFQAPATGYAYADWLEEMSALMMEDLVGLRITGNYNAARDLRVPRWFGSSALSCPLTDFQADPQRSCFSYDALGSFGAWLLRAYGAGFYRALLRDGSSVDSRVLLDHSIRVAGGPGLDEALRRWGTSGFLASGSPSGGYGFPTRNEDGYALPAITGKGLFESPARLDTALPVLGQRAAARTPQTARYSETFQLPAHSVLTVIVRESGQ